MLTSEVVTRTVIARQNNVYSSFPTMVEHDGDVYIYYRQAKKSFYQCHGLYGRVRRLRVGKTALLNHFAEDTDIPIVETGQDICVFAGENELDSIVCRLRDDLFTLCSRVYVKGKIAVTYVSFADTPVFGNRYEVVVRGIKWLVFYGKPLSWELGYVFPAYGVLEGRTECAALVLYTTDFVSWTLLSHIQGNGIILNENSIVRYNDGYVMFIRQDNAPYGIWYAQSKDLRRWSEPVRLMEQAHAPMAIVRDNRCFLSFRRLYRDELSAVSVMLPFEDARGGNTDTDIEIYEGDLFDGGYTDPVVIDNSLFVVYYVGNFCAEPSIRLARLT
ncbi:MAG: exo-alpha-sialidase [Magnetococcales bacterium]|uniref:Exo-alpha-sialidase n=1 Tax=Candidatus Magnetobacterium casense TaxID=1455061 RepID=A0ABS6RWC0_9BACT|nr:sialidase family protein [Candidatus Magnetobacterium casensis]MBF0605943.1 exo-alpha-sialidase [Nitrospirota bacterium]MBV6340329.1 exo-alpha-sialidase [Candidatus Magnetobacterium casensis]